MKNPYTVSFATTLAVLLASTALLPGLAQAQKKVPGEKWKMSVSMEAQGMSMPARTTEICAPVGKADEAMARPDGNSSCTMQDVQRSGGKFSAKIRCTTPTVVEGTIEQVTEGNRMRGTMRMKMSGMDMTMKYDSTKLGTACEAVDYSNYKAPEVPAVNLPQPVDTCRTIGDTIAKEATALSSFSVWFLGENAQCGKAPSFKAYCSAVQTPAGFLSLSKQERDMKAARAQPGVDPAAYTPLSSSLTACGLGKDPAALRAKLLASAEASSNWDFLVLEGNDATFANLVATAKRECAGRSYTSAGNSKYASLCRQYGTGLLRGDKAQVRESAGSSY